MDLADIISLGLSAISIVVAVVALIKSQRTQNQMLRIEQARERDRQVEKRKANITAKLQHLQKHGRYELIIERGVST
jgi:heme exporter protein D